MYNHECFYSELVTLITTMHYVKSFLFFPFGESSGLEMAGWLAGLGAGQAGWAGRQAGWSWPVPRPASQPAISSPELFPKKEKKKKKTVDFT